MSDKTISAELSLEDIVSLTATVAPFSKEKPFVIAPQNHQIIDLEKYLPAPVAIKRAPVFLETDDFINYIAEFRHGHNPRLFYVQDDTGFAAKCVIDYDPATGIEPATPSWGTHRPQLNLAWDMDYAAWRSKSGVWFEQDEFALFVEENLHVIQQPSGAEMLELAQELRGSKNASWEAGQRLNNGQRALKYVEEISATSRSGDIIIPDELTLMMPIYRGEQVQQIRAAFSWRLQGTAIRFSYRLMSKVLERKAQDKMRARLQEQLQLTPYLVKSLGSADRG